MEPGERALDPDSGLVRMGEGGLEEFLFDGVGKPVERFVRVDNDLLDGGGADRGPEEILAHPGETVEGKERVDMGVGPPSFDVRAVLDRNGHLRRKGSMDRFPAAGTAVFGRHQPLGRKIENLSGGDGQAGVLFERPEYPQGHLSGLWTTILSGVSTGERVCPRCPFCPPGFLSVGG